MTPTDHTGIDAGTHTTDSQGAGAIADRGTTTVSTGTARRRNPWPLVVAVLILVGVGIGGAYFWQSRQEAQTRKDEPQGTASSKAALATAKAAGAEDPSRRLGADGEERATPAAPIGIDTRPGGTPKPHVPAIERDLNGGPTGAAPIPVQGAPAAPPRSRFDAPSSFDSAGPYGTAPRTAGSGTIATNRGGSRNTTGTASTPDYSVPAGNLPAFSAQPYDRNSLNLSTLKTPAAMAAMIGNRDFILAKGAFIDCDLDTAINSTLPGLVRCTTTKDTWSDSGRVVLIGRGSTITGEYRSDIQTGQARIQIVWSRIKTPEGVVIEPASPATDALGRAGVDGDVDNHWFERIGSAFMLSLIKDAIAYATATNGTNASTGVAYQNTQTSGEQMANQILKQTINIPPTITRAQGTRVKIAVARDLDFSSVYTLKVAP